jgi:hypothetical protein
MKMTIPKEFHINALYSIFILIIIIIIYNLFKSNVITFVKNIHFLMFIGRFSEEKVVII